VSFDVNGNIRVSPLIEALKKKGFVGSIDSHLISYFSSSHDCFVYLGIDPLLSNTSIPPGSPDKDLIIKCRPKALPSYGYVFLGSMSGNVSKGSRRTKERKIGDVIMKVSQWRKYYNGI